MIGMLYLMVRPTPVSSAGTASWLALVITLVMLAAIVLVAWGGVIRMWRSERRRIDAAWRESVTDGRKAA